MSHLEARPLERRAIETERSRKPTLALIQTIQK